jgi:hypothetical protein
LTPFLREFPDQIKNHVFSIIYRHEDESNARKVEDITEKNKKKAIGCNSALDSLC